VGWIILLCHIWDFSKPLYIDVISEFIYRNPSSNLSLYFTEVLCRC